MKKRKTSPIWLMPRAEFAILISESRSCGEVLAHFGFSRSGNNWGTVKRRCVDEGIDISHFDGRGIKLRALARTNIEIPLDLVLVENSTYSRNVLKKRLLKSGILKNKCSICGLHGVWNSLPIKMRLDHINGVFNDNRIGNLRMVCPNCDSQLDTFCSKNKGRVVRNNCTGCGKLLGRYSMMCRRCSGKRRFREGNMCKVVWPPPDMLKEESEILGNVTIAKRLGVSETAVRKRLLRLAKHGMLTDRLMVGQGTLTP